VIWMATLDMKTDWRFRALIRSLGGILPVTELINNSYDGEPLSHETTKGWYTRNSIPSQYLPMLLIHAIDKGYIKDVKFLRARGDDDLR